MHTDELMRVLASFEKAGLDYAVVGGVALNLHGLVRATEDLDVFIRPTEENIEKLRDGLRIRVASPRILYWMKKDTVREIDHVDAERLKERFRLDDPEG